MQWGEPWAINLACRFKPHQAWFNVFDMLVIVKAMPYQIAPPSSSVDRKKNISKTRTSFFGTNCRIEIC